MLLVTAIPVVGNMLFWWCAIAQSGSLLCPPEWLPELFMRHLPIVASGLGVAGASCAALSIRALAVSSRIGAPRAHLRAYEVCLVVSALVGAYWILALLAGFVYSLGPRSD